MSGFGAVPDRGSGGVGAIAQTVSEKPSNDVRRVGQRLCSASAAAKELGARPCIHASSARSPKPAKERIRAHARPPGLLGWSRLSDAFIRDYGQKIYFAPAQRLRVAGALCGVSAVGPCCG